MADAVQNFADVLFMPYVVAVLLGGGLYLTVRLGFVQFRRIKEAFYAMLARESTGAVGALTPFQAFMTALGASIGTGNIAGVATAIISGGPGALFWIWVYGLVATAIKFSEAVLGVKYRQTTNGVLQSGPMYYLRDGLRQTKIASWGPALAWTYAFVAGIAALTTTPFTQPNSIAVAINGQFPSGTIALPYFGDVQRTALFAGVAVAVLTWLVIIGGIKSIGRAAETLAPLKIGLYLIGGIIVIGVYWARLPYVFSMVVREALTMKSAMGFGLFIAMRYGIARGVYANEAGYGTAAVAYGTAKSARPDQQGLQAVMEVFIVSFVTATISAMAILVTGVAEQSIILKHAGMAFPTSTAAVATAFNAAMPVVGGYVVAFCAFLFGYTTLIGWAYYGEQFLEYILGRKVALPYRWIYCLLIPFGATIKPEVVWAWGDLMNALQVFPNMIGLIAMGGITAVFAWRRN